VKTTEPGSSEQTEKPRIFKEGSISAVPKVCSADPKGSATGSQEIRGYISVVDTFNFL